MVAGSTLNAKQQAHAQNPQTEAAQQQQQQHDQQQQKQQPPLTAMVTSAKQVCYAQVCSDSHASIIPQCVMFLEVLLQILKHGCFQNTFQGQITPGPSLCHYITFSSIISIVIKIVKNKKGKHVLLWSCVYILTEGHFS